MHRAVSAFLVELHVVDPIIGKGGGFLQESVPIIPLFLSKLSEVHRVLAVPVRTTLTALAMHVTMVEPYDAHAIYRKISPGMS